MDTIRIRSLRFENSVVEISALGQLAFCAECTEPNGEISVTYGMPGHLRGVVLCMPCFNERISTSPRRD